MTPSFFLTICLGGIICLTPLAVYLLWLAAINRKNRPTIVAAAWDFAAMLVGLAGFLFCTGVLLGTTLRDSGLIVHGPFSRLVAWVPWIHPAFVASLSLYLLLVAFSIWRGLAARKHSLSAFNIDIAGLNAAIDGALFKAGRAATKAGGDWIEAGVPLIEVVAFPVFRHATVKLKSPEASLRQTLESELRLAVPKLPAAAVNPAAPWIASAVTCTIVAASCCVVLIFALPFLR